MVKFNSTDFFHVVKNAHAAGILELLPLMNGKIEPGDRFFESLQKYVLDTYELEAFDKMLYNLAPTFAFMADPKHWEPADFTAEEMFRTIRNLQKMGVLDVFLKKWEIPGAGDRVFEYYQEILVHKIGVETLEKVLHTMGQCIRFLATDAALVNM